MLPGLRQRWSERKGSYTCGGSSASTDRRTQLTSEGELRNLSDVLGKEGEKLFTSGTGDVATGKADTEKASKYYSDILSGDPTKVLAAASPEINAISSQADQQKKQLANLGGSRTGGTNATTQDLAAQTRGETADVIAKKRQEAATGVERTGAQASNVGLTETGQGLGAQGEQAGIQSTLESNAIASRGQSQKIHDAAVQQWADLVSAILVG